MRTIGLVGGISWTSTLDYDRRLNEGVNARLGGLDYARCLVYSINFGELQRWTWPNSFELLRDACHRLVAGGAEGIALGATTAHLFADALAAELPVPLVDRVRGVILGCTELPMLLAPSDFALPVFDTVAIHVAAMARFAAGE